MLLRFLPHYAADDDGGSGAGDPPEGKVKPSDILARYGQTAESALRMAEKLSEAENENWRVREVNRKLRQDVTDLKSTQPADGGKTLTKDEASAYDAYVALGKKPDEIKTALASAETATQELSTLRRKQQLHDVQAVTGYDPDVLGDIGPDWQFVAKEETVEGALTKVYYVKEGDTETRIDQHPKVMKFKAALVPAVQADTPPPESAPRGTSFIQQHSSSAPAGDKAAQFIAAQEERRKAQTNPLMKPQGA